MSLFSNIVVSQNSDTTSISLENLGDSLTFEDIDNLTDSIPVLLPDTSILFDVIETSPDDITLDSISENTEDIIDINENIDIQDLPEKKVISTPTYSFSSALKDTVLLEFVKENVVHSPDSLYFNVLKIVNYKFEPIKGELSINAPEGWNIISAQGNIINLDSSDSAFIPLRLAVDKEAVGAFTYILNASLKTEDELFSSNAYISIPGIRKWKMEVNKSIITLNQFKETEELGILLSNKGNTTETIKLEYKIGGLLMAEGVNDFSNSYYIILPSQTDTLIKMKIRYNDLLSYDEIKSLEQNWKESSVDISASTFEQQQKKSIWFKKLKSQHLGSRMSMNSPLNFGITASNLLSGQPIRFNADVYGTILFANNHNLSYSARIYGFGLESESLNDFDFRRRTNILVKYNHDKFSAQVGTNISGGAGGVGFSGLGFKVDYKIDKTTKISLGAMNSKSVRDAFGGFMQFAKRIYNINLFSGLSFATYPSSNLQAYSASLGTSFSFLKYHNFSASVFRSTSSLSTFIGSDTLYSTMGYNLGYSVKYKKFRLLANYRDYVKFAKRIGQDIGLQSSYDFKKKMKFQLTYDRRKSFYDISQYNLDKKSLTNINDYGRLTLFILTNHSVSYGVGPQYIANIRQQIDNSSYYISDVATYNPKFHLSVNKRISKKKYISAFMDFGLAYINYSSEDTLISPIKMNNKTTYSIGSTYKSNFWRFSIAYNVGSVTDMWSYINYHTMFPNYDLQSVMTESIVIRPYYERSILNNKGRTQFMANYTYYMPSGRENLSLSSNTYFFLNKGWSASINANMYIGSVVDDDYGRVTSKNVNVQLGVRKSFDIQQPRLKYYDLTFVCFNDLNGNKIKEENEPPLPNIQVTFERTTISEDLAEQNIHRTNFALIELITSPDGETFYGDIPQGRYKVQFTPLFDMQDLYNVNGAEQIISIIAENTTVFVPYAETYKLKGQIKIERDEFSSEGQVSIEGIRVTATNPVGESYSVLTDKNGNYVLSVPQAQTYVVKVNNVFGDQFMCEKDEYSVHFNGIKVIKLDFKFFEKKRKVNFSSNIDQFYIFKSLSANQPVDTKKGIKSFDADIDTSAVLNYVDVILDSQTRSQKPKDTDELPVSELNEAGLIFKVQLFEETTERKTYGDFKSFSNVKCIQGENDGLIYLVGSYDKYENIKIFLQDAIDLGFSEAKIVPFRDSQKITLEEAGVNE